MPQLESRLLVVTDQRQTGGRPLLSVLEKVVKAGSLTLQLRERDLSSRDLLELAREVRALMGSCSGRLVVNDRIDVALAFDDVGTHLRSNSLPVAAARRLLGSHRLLGVSAHSVREVERAEAEGADYIVLGPIYTTPSKRMFGPPLGLHRLEEACSKVRVPVVGIGGITAARVVDVRRTGAFGVAVISAILGAADVEFATRELLDALSSS